MNKNVIATINIPKLQLEKMFLHFEDFKKYLNNEGKCNISFNEQSNTIEINMLNISCKTILLNKKQTQYNVLGLLLGKQEIKQIKDLEKKLLNYKIPIEREHNAEFIGVIKYGRNTTKEVYYIKNNDEYVIRSAYGVIAFEKREDIIEGNIKCVFGNLKRWMYDEEFSFIRLAMNNNYGIFINYNETMVSLDILNELSTFGGKIVKESD